MVSALSQLRVWPRSAAQSTSRNTSRSPLGGLSDGARAVAGRWDAVQTPRARRAGAAHRRISWSAWTHMHRACQGGHEHPLGIHLDRPCGTVPVSCCGVLAAGTVDDDVHAKQVAGANKRPARRAKEVQPLREQLPWRRRLVLTVRLCDVDGAAARRLRRCAPCVHARSVRSAAHHACGAWRAGSARLLPL